MINNFKDGGLRMLDIKSFNKALKCSWIKKYLDDENKGKWKLFLDLELECLGGKMFFTYNLSKNDLLNRVHFKDPFLTLCIPRGWYLFLTKMRMLTKMLVMLIIYNKTRQTHIYLERV